MFLTQNNNSSNRSPVDDFWFQPIISTTTGVRVSPERAMMLSTVYACIKVLAETVAQLPFILYERLDNEGKGRARKQPLYRTLGVRPNKWQTSFEWREMMQAHAALRGNGYSEIIYSANGRILQLIPLHPDRVKLRLLSDTNFYYDYTEKNGHTRRINRGQMFHLRGLSFDGFNGISPIEYERESIGEAIAAQEYGARFFQNDATPRGWVEHPGKFKDDDARNNWIRQWKAARTGANRHSTAVLERGMKYHEVGVTNKDIQFLETRKYKDVDIARIFRISPHKIGILDKSSFNNIEHLGLEFVTDTMMPWFRRWEQAVSRDLIVDEDRYFAEFLVDSLLRGDMKSRSEMYTASITSGWLTRNEVRKKENMNPIDGLDKPLEQLNMAPAGERNQAIRLAACNRVVSKEALCIKRWANKNIDKINDFYETHGRYVSECLALDMETASEYAAASYNEVMAVLNQHGDIDALLEDWAQNRAKQLLTLRSQNELSVPENT